MNTLSRISIGLFASTSVLLFIWLLLPGSTSDPYEQPAFPDIESFETMLASHPYSQSPRLTREQLREIPKRDRPDLAVEQDFLITMDPATGEIPIERLHAANRLATELKTEAEARGGGPLVTEAWEERGPNNVGGRTRALLFDPNDAEGKKVWAGGVDGGLWYTDDITLISSGWRPVGDFWANIAITVYYLRSNGYTGLLRWNRRGLL